MNAVGIDISKGKSTVAVMQPLGVVVAEPFDVFHTDSDLKNLAAFIKSLPGETKVGTGADHGTMHALITWLSCTDHVTAHALMTWLFGH